MRVPSIGWNLRRTPSLAQQWLACSLGSKLRVLHPPSQYLPDPINVFLEGYVETLNPFNWSVGANVSLADANRIFVLAADSGDVGEFLGHLDWDTCVIHQATVTTTATSFTVDTTPLMTTVADDFPFDILVGFERMTVTNCVGASNPQTLTVTRSVNTVVAAHVVNEVVTLHPESACYLDL
jgi:hypothetical protein